MNCAIILNEIETDGNKQQMGISLNHTFRKMISTVSEKLVEVWQKIIINNTCKNKRCNFNMKIFIKLPTGKH